MLVYPQWYDGVGTNKVRIVCHSEDYSELDQFEICFTLDFLSAFNAMELYHHGRFGGGAAFSCLATLPFLNQASAFI